MLEKNLDQKFVFKKKLEHFSERKKPKRLSSKKYQPNPIENPLGKHQNDDKLALSRISDGAERATGASHQECDVNNVSSVCEPFRAIREPEISKIGI